MERLNQDELLEIARIQLIGCQPCDGCIRKKKGCRLPQAYEQIRELILCEDMVQQYRDEKDMEHAELELTYLDIVLDLYEQLEKKPVVIEITEER